MFRIFSFCLIKDVALIIIPWPIEFEFQISVRVSLLLSQCAPESFSSSSKAAYIAFCSRALELTVDPKRRIEYLKCARFLLREFRVEFHS